MTYRRMTVIGVASLVLASGAWVLGLGPGAWAQGDFTGVVRHIEPATRTIEFTDGRIMQLKPGATLQLDGRVVSIDDLQPGHEVRMAGVETKETTVIETREPAVHATASTSATTATASGGETTVTVVEPGSQPPVHMAGVVARIDRDAGVITFEDGRTVKITERTMVWQHVPVAALSPGTYAFVSDSHPSMTWSERQERTYVSSAAPASASVSASPRTDGKMATMRTNGKMDRMRANLRADRPGTARNLVSIDPSAVQVLWPPQAP